MNIPYNRLRRRQMRLNYDRFSESCDVEEYLLLGLVYGKSSRFLVNSDPISCDFESGFCDYIQQHNDNYDWSIGSGRTRSGYTGPSSDHSTNTGGHYAFIDSSEHNPGKTARIISPIYKNPSLDHYRVQFWYDMEGRDIGTLNVYARDYGHSLGTPLLSLIEDQGPGWHEVCLDIPHDFDRFQIAFEALSFGNRGDIAIDDVKLSLGSCNIATRNISCDFELDNCGYEFYSDTKYRWIRKTGGTPTHSTGPGSDHTTGTATGIYVYAEANNGDEGDVAGLISPSFETGDQHVSVKFWYHMYGNQMGELNVFYVVGEWQSDQVFYKGWHSMGTAWKYGCINLPLYSHNIRLVFEAEHGWGYHADIAIDDITLQYGFCKESHVPPPSSVQQTSTITPVITTTKGPSGHWSRWSSYSACPGCGSNVISTSSRSCIGGNDCVGQGTRTRNCNLPDCKGPTDGNWSIWSTWSSCSRSCELGQITRSRSCDNPAPSSGGMDCQGSIQETKDCSLGICPTWTHWFEGPCSSTCGNGTMERLRTCSTGHMEDCVGNSYEIVSCVGVICIE